MNVTLCQHFSSPIHVIHWILSWVCTSKVGLCEYNFGAYQFPQTSSLCETKITFQFLKNKKKNKKKIATI